MKQLAPKSHIKAQFGARIRHIRRRQGLTQERLGLMVGLDRTYLNGIERGKRNVSLENIAKIADGLGLTLSELFQGIETIDIMDGKSEKSGTDYWVGKL